MVESHPGPKPRDHLRGRIDLEFDGFFIALHQFGSVHASEEFPIKGFGGHGMQVNWLNGSGRVGSLLCGRTPTAGVTLPFFSSAWDLI